MKRILFFFILAISLNISAQGQKWTKEKADGANFIPSNAINQLEMWQEATFDPATIDKEIGYDQGIGFNTMRVFLHSLAYKADPKGFKKLVDKYLEIATKRYKYNVRIF